MKSENKDNMKITSNLESKPRDTFNKDAVDIIYFLSLFMFSYY